MRLSFGFEGNAKPALAARSIVPSCRETSHVESKTAAQCVATCSIFSWLIPSPNGFTPTFHDKELAKTQEKRLTKEHLIKHNTDGPHVDLQNSETSNIVAEKQNKQ